MFDITGHAEKRYGLEDLLSIAIEWIRSNRHMFISIAGITVGAILFVTFFFVRLHSAKARSMDRLSVVQGQIFAGQIDQAVRGLDEIITKYGGTAAASQAGLLKADYLSSRQDYAGAEAAVRPVVENGTPRTIMPLAYMVLGDIQENKGDMAGAVQTYTTFLEKYPDHFLVPKAYESLGRVQEIMGSREQARIQYEKLATMFPGSGWAQRAQEHLGTASKSNNTAPGEKKQ